MNFLFFQILRIFLLIIENLLFFSFNRDDLVIKRETIDKKITIF